MFFFMNIFLKEKFALSSQPMNVSWMNTCVTRKENSLVVVFFRFIESESFFTLSFFFFFFLFLFVLLSVNGGWVSCSFFICFAIHRCQYRVEVTNLVFCGVVSFKNTINYLTISINNETSFINTTPKGLL